MSVRHDRRGGYTFTTRSDAAAWERAREVRRALCFGEEVTVISREQYLENIQKESTPST